MNDLSNAFSLLALDVPDNEIQITTAAANNAENAKGKGKNKKKGDSSGDIILSKDENVSQQNLKVVLGEYKLPLVWIDLEMTDFPFYSIQLIKSCHLPILTRVAVLAEIFVSQDSRVIVALKQIRLRAFFVDNLVQGIFYVFCPGPLTPRGGLNVEVDRILEIACVITDGNLTKSIEGPDLVIHQSKECLDKMGEWCQSHHAESGLTKRVLQSRLSEQEAEKQVVEFVKKNLGAHTPLLAGNSVYVDLLFLKKYMPDLASLVPHVLVDVSSVKALCIRWHPKDSRKAPKKKNKHRAMDDIKESIAELKYYRDNIFKPRSRN